jgi:hypothetical protein
VHGAVAIAPLDALIGAQARLESRIAAVEAEEFGRGVPDLTIEHGVNPSLPRAGRVEHHWLLNSSAPRRFQTKGLQRSF